MSKESKTGSDVAVESSRLVILQPNWRELKCGQCRFYTGEECDGLQHEGEKRYSDSEACSDFNYI